MKEVICRHEPLAIGNHLSCSFTSISYGSPCPCVSWASLSIGGSDSSGDCTPDSSLSFLEGVAAMLYYFRAAAAEESFLRSLPGQLNDNVSPPPTPPDAAARTRQTFLSKSVISALSAARRTTLPLEPVTRTQHRDTPYNSSTKSRLAGAALARWTRAASN